MCFRINSRCDDGLYEGKIIGFKVIEMYLIILVSKYSFCVVNLVEKWIFVGIEMLEWDREEWDDFIFEL